MGADKLEEALKELTSEVRELSTVVTRLETRFEQVPKFVERLDSVEHDLRKHETQDAAAIAGLQANVKRLVWTVGVFFTSIVGVAIALFSRDTP